MDIDEAKGMMFDEDLTENFVDEQLRNTFEYENDTVIDSNAI